MLYKLLAQLLCYPESQWLSQLHGVPVLLDNDPAVVARLTPLLKYLTGRPLLEVQANYVATFDEDSEHALYLYHHLYGDSPDRGSVMSALIEEYRAQGLEPTESELPDFLPRYLEFLSHLKGRMFQEHAARIRPVVSLLFRRLSAKQSPYAAVFDSLDTVLTQRRAVRLLSWVRHRWLRGTRISDFRRQA